MKLSEIARDRATGKTTAICKAAKEIGATVITHSQEEANRINKVYGVKAKSMHSIKIGDNRGPYLVDTHAVMSASRMYEEQLEVKDKEIDMLHEAVGELKETIKLTNQKQYNNAFYQGVAVALMSLAKQDGDSHARNIATDIGVSRKLLERSDVPESDIEAIFPKDKSEIET